MNSEAVKEIVLKVNGDYAERELKKIQQNIVKARKEKEAFLKNAPDASSWTKEQEKQWRELNATIGKGERQLKRWGNSADQIKRVLDNLSGSSMKELKGNLKSLEKLMDSGAIKRNTKDWENLVEAIKSTQSEKPEDEHGVVTKQFHDACSLDFVFFSLFMFDFRQVDPRED